MAEGTTDLLREVGKGLWVSIGDVLLNRRQLARHRLSEKLAYIRDEWGWFAVNLTTTVAWGYTSGTFANGELFQPGKQKKDKAKESQANSMEHQSFQYILDSEPP